MSSTAISQFIEEVNRINQTRDGAAISAHTLCQQLQAAGIEGKTIEDTISTEEKSILLDSLRALHSGSNVQGDELSKVVLKRKTISELKIPVPGPSSGRAKVRYRTVNVEVRRRRTYVKRAQLQEDLRRKQEAEQAEQRRAEQEREAASAPPPPPPPPQDQQPEQAAAMQPVQSDGGPQQQPPAPEAVKPQTGTPAARPEQKEDTRAPVAPVAPVAAAGEAPEQVSASPKPPAGARKSADGGRRPAGEERAKLHVTGARSARRAVRKRQRLKALGASRPVQGGGFKRPTAPVVRDVELPQRVTVGDLARRMSVKASELIKVMMELGSMVAINDYVDQDTAFLVVEQMGHRPIPLKDSSEGDMMPAVPEQGERVARPPVVAVMGHVDHGKTSLLDAIRKTRVASGEAGGITQHIGAYRVQTPAGDISFLDTPGHEAFAAMRSRGAKVTDLVIIVVAADDGVKPQTVEAVRHARAAGAPIIVAMNKIDREDADVEQIKQALNTEGVVPEDWGGDTQFVPISAKSGEGLSALLEAILLQAELLELGAVVDCPASGVVLESRLDIGRGPVISVLIKHGTLRQGDVILSGQEFGRVRRMIDDGGVVVREAGPATPVEVLGLSGLSNAGDDVVVLDDERRARQLAEGRQDRGREQRITRTHPGVEVENLFSGAQSRESLNLLVKADVQGSTEALLSALAKLGNEQVQVNVIHSGVGRITESDINLAAAASGLVLGFNVRADAAARKQADISRVEVSYFSVIYDVLDAIKDRVSGLTAPEIREQIIGLAEVREIFRSPKFGDIAGCIVTSGVMRLEAPIRVLREDVVIYEGKLESLRRFKDEVKEVQSGVECGIGVKNYNNVQVGDQIEAFEHTEVQRSEAS